MSNRSPIVPAVTSTTVRHTLLAVLALVTLFLGIIAMHASMTPQISDRERASAAQPVSHTETVAAQSDSALAITTVASGAVAVAVIVSTAVLPSETSHLAALIAPHGDHCAGMCAGACTLLAAACMLGISAAIVGLALLLRAAVIGYNIVAAPRLVRMFARRLARPTAPSLVILSICRT